MQDSDHPEPEREIRTLAGQASTLLANLGITVSHPDNAENSEALALKWYERLAAAEKKPNQVSWERTLIDGRNGAELMARLWELKECLHRSRRTHNASTSESKSERAPSNP